MVCLLKQKWCFTDYSKVFFMAKRMGNIPGKPFQAILEHPLEMEVRDEDKYLYTSYFFCEHVLC